PPAAHLRSHPCCSHPCSKLSVTLLLAEGTCPHDAPCSVLTSYSLHHSADGISSCTRAAGAGAYQALGGYPGTEYRDPFRSTNDADTLPGWQPDARCAR